MNTPPRSFAAPPPFASAGATKAQLRPQLRALRRQLKPSLPDAPVHAAQAYALAGRPGVQVAAIYHAQGAEMDAWPLAAVLRRTGAAIALPVAVSLGAALEFRKAREGDPFEVDAAGVLAPGEGAPVVRPDLLIVPLLGFDASGARLGQGGGFYDRTIAALRAEGPLFVLGLGFAGQEVDRLPFEAHDARLDGVLTEQGLRLFAPATEPA